MRTMSIVEIMNVPNVDTNVMRVFLKQMMS